MTFARQNQKRTRAGVPMPEEQYRALPAYNQSLLKYGTIALQLLRHRQEHPEDPTRAMKVSTALHRLLFEPDRYAKSVAYWAGGHRGRNRAAWEAFQRRHKGALILDGRDRALVEAMAKSIRANRKLAPYLAASGACEHVLLWTDPKTGLACKARPDKTIARRTLIGKKATARNIILDVKKVGKIGGAHPDRVKYYIRDYGCDFQGAYYADGFRQVTGEAADVLLIFVEEKAPFLCAHYWLSEDALAAGRKSYRRVLAAVAAAKKSKRWPGYDDGGQVGPPAGGFEQITIDGEDMFEEAA